MLHCTVDLRRKLGDVRDQGNRPTCLAFAFTAAHEAGQVPTEDLSEEFLVWQCHRRGNNVTTGLNLGAVIAGLRDDGQPLEVAWPYSLVQPAIITYEPPDSVRAATIYCPAAIHRLPLPLGDALRANLDAGFPAVLAVRMWESFMMASRGMIPLPKINLEQSLDSHSVLVVGYGYDNNQLQFLFRNSWGDDWGEGGHGLLPVEYVDAHSIGGWVVRC